MDNKNELRIKLHNSKNKYIHKWFIFSGIIVSNKRNILINEKKKKVREGKEKLPNYVKKTIIIKLLEEILCCFHNC